ncbi:shikimate dehydrogenase [Nesterenkonia populi]|uniref:shikimate dehydrogenase n=1 Tax=Nesterenkonia populi TaxID=1591087 RepID=UPI001FEB0A80|nr:shikimate dehydrogenase [Nesterenkonia populi]
MRGASGEARRAAVLGSPIGHSKSPALHAAAYRHLGLEIGYARIEADETTLDDFLAGEGAEPGWVGFSVTMPLKAAMVRHMTTSSMRVQDLGVLNTVVIREAEEHHGGRRHLHGENTDVDGIVTTLREDGLSRDEPAGGSFAVLGAGGTAAAALAAAAELGFGRARIYARTPEKAAAARPLAQRLGLELMIRPMAELGHDLADVRNSVVVSALPPSAADELVSQLPPLGVPFPPLLDVAYDPWPSALAAAWQERGGRVVSGLHMLLHQAVKQVELFTAGTANPAAELSSAEHARMVDAMRAAAGLS